MCGSRNFRQGGGGGGGSGPGQTDKKKAIFFFSPQLILQISKKSILFQGSRGGPTFSRGGPTFSRGGGGGVSNRNPYNL